MTESFGGPDTGKEESELPTTSEEADEKESVEQPKEDDAS